MESVKRMEQQKDLKHILVVDDDAGIRDLLVQYFTSKGYAVAAAQNALEAMQQSVCDRPALMLLDMVLPDMSGMDLCEVLRDKHPQAAFFAMTGYPSLFEQDDCAGIGFDAYFTKPFDLDRLGDAVSAALAA